MTRSESREQAFILNFEMQFSDCGIDETIMLAGEVRDFKLSAFALQLVSAVDEHRIQIDQKIAELAKNWDTRRISKVSLSALQLAMAEMMAFSDIPVSVTINEAVELCKKYGGEDDYAFVNGILGSFAKALDRSGGKEA